MLRVAFSSDVQDQTWGVNRNIRMEAKIDSSFVCFGSGWPHSKDLTHQAPGDNVFAKWKCKRPSQSLCRACNVEDKIFLVKGRTGLNVIDRIFAPTVRI